MVLKKLALKKPFQFIGVLFLILFWMPGILFSQENEAYKTVYQQLSKLNHRQAGSQNFQIAANVIKETLAKEGIQAIEQSFETVLPHTHESSLIIDGMTVPAMAFSPNGVGLATTSGNAFQGPLVYCGNGDLNELRGLQLENSIAVLEMGSPHGNRVFQEGALAILYVGNESYNLWTVRKSFTEIPLQLPRMFVERKVAQKYNLLNNQENQEAVVKISSSMKETTAKNLWVHIPGKRGKTFNLEEEELILLSSQLDTFGAVPDLSPDERQVANTALLVENLIALNKEELDRGVLAVFLGSRFSQQDGARNFFYAYEKSQKSVLNKDPLPLRLEYYQTELAQISGWENRLQIQDFYNGEQNDDFFEVNKQIRQGIKNKQNDINIGIRDLVLRVKYKNDKSAADGIKTLEIKKRLWNELLRQVHNLEIENQPNAEFEKLRSQIQAEITHRKDTLNRFIENNASYRELSKVFENKKVVSYFHYDFASDSLPWMFNVITNYDFLLKKDSSLEAGTYIKHLSLFTKLFEKLPQKIQGEMNFISSETLGGTKMDGLTTPVERRLPIVIGFANGIPSFSFTTAGDYSQFDDVPRRQATNLESLVETLPVYLKILINDEGLSTRSPTTASRFNSQLIYTLNGDKPYGDRYLIQQQGGSEIEGPAKGAIAFAYHIGIGTQHAMPGYATSPMGMVNANGNFFIPQSTAEKYTKSLLSLGYDESGRINRILQDNDWERLFYSYGGGYSISYNPVNYNFLSGHLIINARGNSRPRNYRNLITYNHASLFVDKEEPLKIITDDYIVTNALNKSEKAALGVGFQKDLDLLHTLNAVRASANDFTFLNESRLERLRAKNIINDSIEVLHLGAVQHVKKSKEARENGDIGLARAHESFAASLAQRAYTPLKQMSNDMVYAVVILLILSMPFAFAMERLTIGATTIYRQIAYYLVYFTATFTTLYIVHPAFSLAKSPIVILLAFAIVLMSAIVIYLVMGKFKQEIKALQGLGSASHGSESESSTAMAAILIGIAGLRNRPLKTFLTSATIVLLTFTILAFAAFSSKTEVTETYLGPRNGMDRIEVHQKTFLNIPNELVESIRTLYDPDFHTMERRIVSYDPTKKINYSPSLIAINPSNNEIVKLDSIMGFDSLEFQLNSSLQEIVPNFKIFSSFDYPGAFLSEFIAERTQLKKGDPFAVNGKKFSLAGTYKGEKLSGSSYLDNSTLLPIDFKAVIENSNGVQTHSAEDLEQMDTSSFRWSEPTLVLITSNQHLSEFEYATSSLQLYPKGGSSEIDTAAEDIAQIFVDPVYSSSSSGSKQFFFGDAISGSGFSEVLVPLLLGGLIIFSSLMGSIVDREKEIFTYSALGLSPPDVGMLFFAESAIYSVIGGMGGYLFSQVVAKLLSLAGHLGIFTPPEMNFSSLSSILTILIVMLVVMLSTIYPALKAGKSANPGVARKWRMPPPRDNQIEFLFPFTVSSLDIEGVLAFIKEHFDNHQDASLGLFAAQNTKVTQDTIEGKSSLGIEATVSLAPFDLGVNQHFKLYSKPSDIDGIEEVMVRLNRVNGSMGAWKRGNLDFINDLRSQFLLWRSLPEETVRYYKEVTSTEIKHAIEKGMAQ